MATPYDAAWKLLFSFPEMVRDLLAGFVPTEWVHDLDLSAPTRHPEGQVTDDARERHPDRVWEVGMRDRSGSVLVTFEFQSTVDRTMAVRVLVYTAMLYQDRLRRSAAPLPPVLPIVVYYGPGEWTAQESVAGLCAAPGASRAPCQPAQRHFVLDVGRYTGPLPEGRNWMAELVRLARTPDPEVVAAELCDISERWQESRYDSLLDAILTWLGQVHFPMHGIKLEIPKLANVREAVTMLHQVGVDWSAKLRAEG
ncbi:MAG: Rpn family recombination-promoting nuclease/putative transposase, partial [Chromatiales bacterium]|nr:Rpn family recombination-promoting nuclease/putative transposase [Chromatiales bacterium]